MDLNDSWPACHDHTTRPKTSEPNSTEKKEQDRKGKERTVSQIWSLIGLESMVIIRAPNSTPMVRSWTGWKRLSVNWRRRHDFPTPTNQHRRSVNQPQQKKKKNKARIRGRGFGRYRCPRWWCTWRGRHTTSPPFPLLQFLTPHVIQEKKPQTTTREKWVDQVFLLPLLLSSDRFVGILIFLSSLSSPTKVANFFNLLERGFRILIWVQ